MPSLFSRSRTFSTPHKRPLLVPDDTFDEFGRVSSRQSNRSAAAPSKKDKKKGREQAKRSGTLPGPSIDTEVAGEVPFPDGTFLPLNLERPRSDPEAAGQPKENDYGYLCHERHVVLGLEQLERLVEVVSGELETRGGVTTPFIFTNTALDISSSGIKRLIHSFINTCAPPSEREAQVADLKWKEEARFAGPHELGMCLRWGLARVIRSVGGQDLRGLVSWEHYTEWADSEVSMRYPPAHFQTFLPSLPQPLQFIIIRLLTLLSRLIANSTSSGHTPPTLSPLFGPLFFGLGPPTLAFHHAYVHYLRSVNAMEHVMLSFIRWQDAPRSSTASAASLGVPTRLKEWIKGYPANLPFLQNPKAKPQPRKGSRTVRVMSVRRNVRMYTPDLVKSASTWGQKTDTTPIHNSFAYSKEWERISPTTLKLPPRYSDAYKKKMNMPNSFHPEVNPGSYDPSSASSTLTAPSLSLSSTLSSTESSSSDYFGLASTERSDDHFRSLTDLKWGEFEDMGFSNTGDNKKLLQFDLTESARQERKSKRQTLNWNDFSSAGFSRMDAPLSATLQFSNPVVNTVAAWPVHQVEIHKKLKKSQKALPAFGWDTEPVIGNEEVIEGAFVDVFCDLVYGGGWMDLERGEALDRDCNWALVEFKSLLPSRSTVSGGADPRTDTTLILFEEFVPFEYRQELALPVKTRRRLPSLFSTSNKKQWKQAATLNGRPYVVGHVPRSPSFREVEFEGMLQASGGTKVISLSKRDAARMQSTTSAALSTELPIPPPPSRPAPTPKTSPLHIIPADISRQLSRSDEMPLEYSTPSKKSRFRIPVPSPSSRRSMMPAEYSTVEFQTRMASYSDDEQNDDFDDEAARQKRRESRADAWVDILVETQARRMDEQSASPGDRRKARIRRSDPDIASLEVAQVLAAVGKERSLSPATIPDRVDRDYGIDQHVYDLDINEVETVPRTRDADGETSESEAHLTYDQETNEGGDIDEVLAPILNARQMAREQRRLGYFDIHPERRPASKPEDDPRDRLANEISDSEDEGPSDGQLYGQPEGRRPLPVPPSVTPKPVHEPPAQRILPEIKISNNLAPVLVPTVAIEKKDGGVTTADVRTPASKTAALIEMYRERERTGSVPQPSTTAHVPPLNPSRLPVRAASLPVKDPTAPLVPLVTVVTAAKLSPSPTPSPKPSPPQPPVLSLPPVIEDPGRISPARYVHGAPLHNVLEEEEEE